MKTIEPIFTTSGPGNGIYPIITVYSVLNLYGTKLIETKYAKILFYEKIMDRKLDTVTVYDLGRIGNEGLIDNLDRSKSIFGLDDDYYLNSDLIRRAIDKSIETVGLEQDLLQVAVMDSSNLLKWQTYDKAMNYINSQPEDQIDAVVKRDILD